jgi:hypothetical protein
VIAAVTPEAAAQMRLAKGTAVWLSLKSLDLNVYGGRRAPSNS